MEFSIVNHPFLGYPFFMETSTSCGLRNPGAAHVQVQSMLVVASVKLQVLVQETPWGVGDFHHIRNGLHEFLFCDVSYDGSYVK